MEFYALLLALAVVICQGEATLIVRGFAKTQESLTKVKLQLINAEMDFIDKDDARRKAANTLAKSNIAELAGALEKARKAGKKSNECWEQLNSTTDNALEEYSGEMDKCSTAHVPNFVAMNARIEKLVTEGRELEERLAEITDDCEDGGLLNWCVWMESAPLKISQITWKVRTRSGINAETRELASAEKKISQCVSSPLADFKKKLSAANVVAKQCTAAP